MPPPAPAAFHARAMALILAMAAAARIVGRRDPHKWRCPRRRGTG
jgi:hypothetical protein